MGFGVQERLSSNHLLPKLHFNPVSSALGAEGEPLERVRGLAGRAVPAPTPPGGNAGESARMRLLSTWFGERPGRC